MRTTNRACLMLAAALIFVGAGVVGACGKPTKFGRNDPSKPRCERADEDLPGPLVPNEEVARAIFLAIERARFAEADVANFPDVVAVDEGDHWAVFRSTQTPGIKGGGQLQMQIGKCTGAISQVYFAK